MVVKCERCGARYDDEFRLTYCPHGTFAANDGANNFRHYTESFRSNPMQADDLKNRFTYHAPTPDMPEKFKRMRDAAHDLAKMIDELVPEGREKSLAVTKLEEVTMWANAGLARTAPAAT